MSTDCLLFSINLYEHVECVSDFWTSGSGMVLRYPEIQGNAVLTSLWQRWGWFFFGENTDLFGH